MLGYAQQLLRRLTGAQGVRRQRKDFTIARLENLELRCLLSGANSGAVAGHVDSVKSSDHSAVAEHSKAAASKADTLPDVSGHWIFTTELGGGESVVGDLQLTQNGRKVTGTLINQLQPPGDFKAKLLPAGKADQTLATLKGKMVNRVVDSGFAKFRADVIGEVTAAKLEGKIKAKPAELVIRAIKVLQ